MIEKTFYDRASTYPGRVKMTPVPGQANTYDMVRADSPTAEGTPIDKAAFDSIIQSRLTGRYYRSSVTRQTVSNHAGTVSPIPSSGWTTLSETSAQNGLYKATASSAFSGSYGPEEAFSGNYATNSGWRSASSDEAPWIAIDLGAPIILTKIKTFFKAAYTATQCFLYGSNNGQNWSYLAGVDEIQTEATEWSFTNSYPYQYYRLSFNNVEVMLYGWELTGYTVTTYKNVYTVAAGWPAVWETGQIALVQIPENVVTLAVVSNTINGITVNTVMLPGKRYELRYTGSAFVAKEV